MRYLDILEAHDIERVKRKIEEATMVTNKSSDLVNMITSIFDDWKSRKHNEQEIAELLAAMGYRIKMDGERAELIKEAPGDIRKFLAGAAIIASLWGVNNHVAQQAYENSPQLQKLITLHQQAEAQGNERAADNYADRIEQHKLRLDLGKGEVMGADGRPKDVEQVDEVSSKKLDSYLKKSRVDKVKQFAKLTGKALTKDVGGPEVKKQLHKMNRRELGNLRAKERLNREEVEQVEESYDDDDAFFEAYGWVEENLEEAEYQGRKVKLNKPMQGTSKKFKVYVKDPKTGNVKVVHFGQKGAKIKKGNPARRKSFRARHNCDNPGPKTKARYWSCRAW